MGLPTTRSGLQTRVSALVTEVTELFQGAHNLAGGLDAGTERQKDAARAIEVRLRAVAKELSPQVVRDSNNNLT
jgi:hypothetical protein